MRPECLGKKGDVKAQFCIPNWSPGVWARDSALQLSQQGISFLSPGWRGLSGYPDILENSWELLSVSTIT